MPRVRWKADVSSMHQNALPPLPHAAAMWPTSLSRPCALLKWAPNPSALALTPSTLHLRSLALGAMRARMPERSHHGGRCRAPLPPLLPLHAHRSEHRGLPMPWPPPCLLFMSSGCRSRPRLAGRLCLASMTMNATAAGAVGLPPLRYPTGSPRWPWHATALSYRL